MIGMKQEPRFLPMWVQLDIDPEILSTINELNDSGYYTEESCAGHFGNILSKNGKHSKWESRGYIHMEEKPTGRDLEEILDIFSNHGIREVILQSVNNNFPTFQFEPFGEQYDYDYRPRQGKKKH